MRPGNPSQEEIDRLKAGEPVIISVWSRAHPPIAIEVPGNEILDKKKMD